VSDVNYLTVLLIAALSAIIAVAVIHLILRTRLTFLLADIPDYRKAHSTPIPRIGGIAIIVSVLAVTVIWHTLQFRTTIPFISGEVFLAVIFAAIAIGVVGVLDDSRSVTVLIWHKLVVTTGLAVLTVFVLGISPGAISVFNLFVIPEFTSKLIAVLWIVGIMNAYNLVDGVDGFAGTVTIISLLGIAAVSYFNSDCQTVMLSLFVLSAVVGFMVFNVPPAKVFMGDTGSYFLGYIVALLTIRAAFCLEDSGKVPVIMPLITSMPILEVFTTIARRYLKSKGKGGIQTIKFILTADSFHLHHRFLLRGFSHLDACIFVGVFMATTAGSAVCIAFSRFPQLNYCIAAYAIIPVTICLYKLDLANPIRVLLNRPKKITVVTQEEASQKIKLAGRMFRKTKRWIFYKDLLTLFFTALPIFVYLGYLILVKETLNNCLCK